MKAEANALQTAIIIVGALWAMLRFLLHVIHSVIWKFRRDMREM
jgi:hypothetical protein